MRKLSSKELKKYGFITSIWIYPAILFFIFYVGVNFNSFILAFQKIDMVGNTTFAGLENFKAFFSQLSGDSAILRISLTNSLLMYAINLVICMPLYIIFSYYLFKKWLFTKAIRIIVMIPAIVSSFIICLLFKQFIETALPGFVRMLTGKPFPQLLTDPRFSFGTTLFYMIWLSFSTSLIIYPNAMASIDSSVFESARIDGASCLRELWSIVLPLIFPTLSTFLITGVAGIFMTSGPLVEFYMFSAPPEVYNMGYYIFKETMAYNKDFTGYPMLAAIGMLLTLISIPLTFTIKFLLDKFDPTVHGGAA